MSDRELAFVREVGGVELAERLVHLDGVRKEAREGGIALDAALPPLEGPPEFDVVFVGGGLSLLLAAAIAARGARVAVFDRGLIGAVHREWNASLRELEALKPIVQDPARYVSAHYDYGFCQFHGGARLPVHGALDVAVDAHALLKDVLTHAEAQGAKLHSRAALVGVGAARHGVRLAFSDGTETSARIVVDARGASSPYAAADIGCPTVGGVMSGYTGPNVGEILVTTEGIEEGRQHVWEGFPTGRGELTTYLFNYAPAHEAGDLLPLFARFFRTLPRYKTGLGSMVRPTFGYIPGWSRTTPPPKAPFARMVLVGDAAARHSPLTFCGFGGMLRSIAPVTDALSRALERDEAPKDPIVHDTALHAWTGTLAKLMAVGKWSGAELNTLLDAAFSSLHSLGEDVYSDFLRDQMTARDFYRFIHRTSKRAPQVYHTVMRDLGPLQSTRWAFGVASRGLFAPTAR